MFKVLNNSEKPHEFCRFCTTELTTKCTKGTELANRVGSPLCGKGQEVARTIRSSPLISLSTF